MKKILLAVLVFLLAGAWTNPAEAARRTYYGYPELKEGRDGQIWILSQDGMETAALGTLAGDKKTRDCLREAAGLDKLIKFSGNWLKKEYGEELDPASAQCSKITKKADCPSKTLRTITIDAVNMGVVCGDFCHLGLLPEHGDEFSILADEEEIEKLFGSKPGGKVRVTYAVEMGWMPEDLENPDDGEGYCSISSVFKSGKVLAK